MKVYKVTRADGTDFHTGKFLYAAAPLTPPELRALQVLEHEAPLDGISASNFGSALYNGNGKFDGKATRKPQAFALPGGRMLQRLKALGFAKDHGWDGQRTLWRITTQGMRELHRLEPVTDGLLNHGVPLPRSRSK